MASVAANKNYFAFLCGKTKNGSGSTEQERDATRWRRVRHGLWRCGFCGQAGGGARA